MADPPSATGRSPTATDEAARAPERYAGERLSWPGSGVDASTPATPRPAATVILLRQGPGGAVETFMVRRSARSRFAPDAYVFPGGTYREPDASPRIAERTAGLSREVAHARLAERGGEPPWSPDLSFGLHVAALRELFEEAGVLLATDEVGAPLDELDRGQADRLATARGELQAGRLELADLLERERSRLAGDSLVYFSHWITPAISPRRFDTRFFVAEMPERQAALHCQIETTAGEWMAPSLALGRCARGEIQLVFVTIEHLRRLAGIDSIEQVLGYARTKPVQTVRPVLDERRGAWRANVGADAW